MKHNAVVKNLAYPLLSVILLIVLWYGLSVAYDNQFILPSPNLVFGAMVELVQQSLFWESLLASLIRCVLSIAISFGTAFLIAIFSVLYKPFHRISSPIITILRSVPTISVIFVILLVFSPKTSPIFVSFLVIMPYMYSLLFASFLGTDKELIETGKVFGLGKSGLITRIYLPLSMPSVVESLSGGFSLSLKILVAAEVLSSTAISVGYLLNLSNLNIQIARLLAITVVVIFVCIIVELTMGLIRDRVSKDLI